MEIAPCGCLGSTSKPVPTSHDFTTEILLRMIQRRISATPNCRLHLSSYQRSALAIQNMLQDLIKFPAPGLARDLFFDPSPTVRPPEMRVCRLARDLQDRFPPRGNIAGGQQPPSLPIKHDFLHPARSAGNDGLAHFIGFIGDCAQRLRPRTGKEDSPASRDQPP